MTRYALLACFLLFTGIDALSIIEHKGHFHEPPSDDETSSSFGFPSERSSYGEVFSVVKLTCKLSEPISSNRCHVHVYTYDEENGTMKNCTLPMDLKVASHNKELDQVTFLAKNEILINFNYREFIEAHQADFLHVSGPRSRGFILDVNKCQKHDVYNVNGNALIGKSKTNDFDIITFNGSYTDRDDCNKEGACQILTFDSKNQGLGTPKSFVADITDITLPVKYLNDREILLMGYNGGYTFKALRVDRYTGKSVEVTKVFNAAVSSRYESQFAVVNHGLHFCWAKHQDKLVHCIGYFALNYATMVQTISFDEAVKPISLYVTSEGDLFLITVVSDKKGCEEESKCFIASGTKIHANGTQMKPVKLPFLCTEQLRIYGFKYEIDKKLLRFQYACKYRNGYSHNEFLIDFSDGERNWNNYLDGCVHRDNGWDCL